MRTTVKCGDCRPGSARPHCPTCGDTGEIDVRDVVESVDRASVYAQQLIRERDDALLDGEVERALGVVS